MTTTTATTTNRKKKKEEKQQQQLLLQLARDRVASAMTLFEEKRGDFGLLYWTDGLRILEQIHGTGHLETAKMHLGLAATHQLRQEYGPATDHFQQALRMYQSSASASASASSLKLEEQRGGGGRYSKGALQALMGLGTTYTQLGKWHEAIKMFQSAARLELYHLLLLPEDDDKQNKPHAETSKDTVVNGKANIRNELTSVSHLKKLIRNIQKNHPKKNKRIWSHFSPSLPHNANAYFDAVQATVQHEVQGDRFFQMRQYQVAAMEYHAALHILQSQVHSPKKVGLPLDKVWLIRKVALAELGADHPKLLRAAAAKPLFPLNELSSIHSEHNGDYNGKDDCPGVSHVCERLAYADALLQQGGDHKALQTTVNQYEEAQTLIRLYRSVQETLSVLDDDVIHNPSNTTFPEQTIRHKVVYGLNTLREQLVPEGQGQSKLPKKVSTPAVWEQLQRLTILVEEAPATLLLYPTSSSSAAAAACSVASIDSSSYSCTHSTSTSASTTGGGIALIWFILIVLQFVCLPLLLFQKARTQQTNARKTRKNELPRNTTRSKAPVLAKEESPRSSAVPPLLVGSSTSTTKTDRTFKFLQALDQMEEQLEALSSSNTKSDEDNKNDETKLLANKVSAIVLVKKTRQSILAKLTEEEEEEADHPIMTTSTTEEDDDDDDDDKVMGIFFNRMSELGFQSMFSRLLFEEFKTNVTTTTPPQGEEEVAECK